MFVKLEIQKTLNLLQHVISDDNFIAKINAAADLMVNALNNQKKIMFCGNGGSAADSQHLVAEFVSRLNYDRPALNAIALTVDTSILTAISNDYGYDKVFSRQVEALGQAGDVLIAISTSGNSISVVEAVTAAKKKGITTIGFLGQNGNKVGNVVDHQLNVPSLETAKIQECHIIIGHILCALIEEKIFGQEYNPKKAAG